MSVALASPDQYGGSEELAAYLAPEFIAETFGITPEQGAMVGSALSPNGSRRLGREAIGALHEVGECIVATTGSVMFEEDGRSPVSPHEAQLLRRLLGCGRFVGSDSCIRYLPPVPVATMIHTGERLPRPDQIEVAFVAMMALVRFRRAIEDLMPPMFTQPAEEHVVEQPVENEEARLSVEPDLEILPEDESVVPEEPPDEPKPTQWNDVVPRVLLQTLTSGLVGMTPDDLAVLYDLCGSDVEPSTNESYPAEAGWYYDGYGYVCVTHTQSMFAARRRESVPDISEASSVRNAAGDVVLDWKAGALCAQTDPEAFFPDKSGSSRDAKRVCLSCEVRVECPETALANDERVGIWGGLSERERRRVRSRAV